MMTLREMMIERILFAATEEELLEMYAIDVESDPDFDSLSDFDLFELYENVTIELVAPEFLGGK